MEFGPTPSIGNDNIPQTPKGLLSQITTLASQANSSEFSLNSISDDHITILVESDDPSYLKNDMKLYRNLQNSPFSKVGIINTRTNISKGLLILTIKNVEKSILDDLLKVNSLGTWKISCRLPENRSKIIGVIGPIELETNLAELHEVIVSKYPCVIKTERLYKTKGKEKLPTRSAKLTFMSDELPENLYVAYRKYPVSLFVDRPWQCYKWKKLLAGKKLRRNAARLHPARLGPPRGEI